MSKSIVSGTHTRRSFVASAGMLALAVAMGGARAALGEEPGPEEDADFEAAANPPEGLEVIFEESDELFDPLEYFPPIELGEDSPYLDLDEDEAAIVGAEAEFFFPPEDDAAPDLLEDLVLDALQRLGKAAWNEALGFGKQSFMSIVFGQDSSGSAMIGRLDEIQQQLDVIEAEIRAVYEYQVTSDLKAQLDDYMGDYAGPSSRYIGTMSGHLDDMDLDHVGDEDGLKTARLEFAENVLFPGTGTFYKVDSATDLYAFVAKMADAILETKQQTGRHVIGAYDELCLHEYKWEHHAYDARQQLRDYVGSRFVTMASYLLVAMRDYLDAHADEKGQDTYGQVRTSLKMIFGTDAEALLAPTGEDLTDDNAYTPRGVYGRVLDLFESMKVQRSADARFQVIGQETAFKHRYAIMESSEDGGTSQEQFFKDALGRRVLSEDAVARLVAGYDGDLSLAEALFGDDGAQMTGPDGAAELGLYALDAPIRRATKKVSDGYNTTVYKKYYLPVVHDDGKRAEALFASSTTQGKKTKWIWYEVEAVGVFMA